MCWAGLGITLPTLPLREAHRKSWTYPEGKRLVWSALDVACSVQHCPAGTPHGGRAASVTLDPKRVGSSKCFRRRTLQPILTITEKGAGGGEKVQKKRTSFIFLNIYFACVARDTVHAFREHERYRKRGRKMGKNSKIGVAISIGVTVENGWGGLLR